MIWNVIMFKKILYSRFTLDAMLTYRSSCSLVLFRIASLKNCTNVTSDMRGIIFLFGLQFYLKKVSIAFIFLYSWWNFTKLPFQRTLLVDSIGWFNRYSIKSGDIYLNVYFHVFWIVLILTVSPFLTRIFRSFLTYNKEAVVRSCSAKEVFLKTPQKTLFKKRLRHRSFPVNFAKCLRARFFRKTTPVAASGNSFCSCGIVVHSKQVILWLNYLYHSGFIRLVLIWTGCCFY